MILKMGDFDAAERAISEFYLPVQLHQRSAARLAMRLDKIAIGRVTLGRLRFGSNVRVTTAPPVNYHINIPLAGRARSKAGAREAVDSAPGTATVFMPGAEADIRWGDDTDQLCLMIDPEALHRELRLLLGQRLSGRAEFAPRMDLSTPAGQSWLRAIKLFEADARTGGSLASHPLAVRRLEQLVIDGFLLAHSHNMTDGLQAASGSASEQAARKAIELLTERPEDPWSVTDLAAEIGVSARSLHAAFRDLTGETPMAYLQQRRLEHARDDLMAARPGQSSVTDIAYSWGFVHLGRFAGAYRARYGESPGQTLRR